MGEKKEKERKNLQGTKYLIKLNNVTFSAVSNFTPSVREPDNSDIIRMFTHIERIHNEI